MLWGLTLGGFELRQAGGGETRLQGRFPYGQETVLREARNGEPELREVFARRAFAPTLDKLHKNIHLLANHDFGKPLGSIGAGSLQLTDTDEALVVEASFEHPLTSWAKDTLTSVRTRLATGLSPGFRLASDQPEAETVTRRGNVILRTVRAAMLEEISIVTRPAYPQAQIEARSWQEGQPSAAIQDPLLQRHPRFFWRYR